jgi:hypothetical protein
MRLEARIGGYMGTSYVVSVSDDLETTWESWSYGQLQGQVAGRVTETEWAQFVAAIRACGVASWASDYCDPDVLDGTSWSVTVRLADREVTSGGSNAYPGSARSHHGTTVDFDHFCSAVAELLGRPFQ